MTEALKIAAAGIICAVLYISVKQLRPEFAPFIQAGGIIALAVMLMEYLDSVFEKAGELLSVSDVIDAAYLTLLVKVLGVAIITKTGADICADNGSSAMKNGVELAGRVLILFLSFPLISAVVSFAVGLLK